jgi:two-component system sensor histidine kinase/response regulator
MKSVQTRFIILMVIIVSSMLGVFGVVSHSDSKSQKDLQLAQHLDDVTQRLSRSLPPAIWRMDREQIRLILNAEVATPDILSVAVHDEKGRPLHIATNPTESDEQEGKAAVPADYKRQLTREFPLMLSQDNMTETLGTVRIQGSSKANDAALQRETVRLFMLILLMNLVIVGALCAAMRLVIMHPLYAVQDALHAIASQDADLSLRLQPSQWVEFEGVTNNFNAFAQRLDHMLGATVDDVHQAISRIAQGDLSSDLEVAANAPRDSVIARLSDMQHSLVKTTAELRVAKQAADAASQAKTDFLANMSHEIRTPLNAILGITRLALRNPLSLEQKGRLDKVMHSAAHLLGIINDILDFSKIEAGKLTLERVPFEMPDVIDNVVTMVADKAADKGLELITDIAPDVPLSLMGDPLRLSQILVNFATNAVKFTQHGEVVVYLRVDSRHDQRVRLRIGVRDTGVGIPPDKVGLLFNSFEQADISTSREYGGTGLGLAITQRLVKLMHGEVGASSVEGVGSDFWCVVSLDTLKAPAVRGAVPQQIMGNRALVVDDQATARDVLVELLREMGLDALGVESGDLALQRVASADRAGAPFAWVFLDWFMPTMDGMETARRLRGLNLHMPPHVVIASALAADDVKPKALTLGIVDVLTKPVSISNVMRLFKRHGSAEDREPEDALRIGTEGMRSAMGARILLVEDLEFNREVAVGLFDQMGLGLKVDCAENGKIALDRMAEKRYDAVFMDMQMPVMDGLAATRAIRGNPAWNDIPVIAMTASVMDTDLQRCRDAGMCDAVIKPVEPFKLRDAIKKWVVAASPSTEAGNPAPTRPKSQSGTSTASTNPSVKASEDALPNLNDIPGLDAEVGLGFVMGKRDVYCRVLRQFAHTNARMPAAMQSALDTSDLREVGRLAHALLGTAAMIGAKEVVRVTRSMETLTSAAEPDIAAITEAVAQLATHLQPLLDAITRLLPEPSDARPPPPPQTKDVATLRKADLLLRMVRDQDARAATYWRVSSASLQGFFEPHSSALDAAITAYDFAEAQRLLEDAVNSARPHRTF